MNTLAHRRFGIELEISRRFVNVAYHDRKKSPIWTELMGELNQLAVGGHITRGWKLKTDTSCGGELVSPPLYAPDGLREIAIVCQMAKRVADTYGKPVVDGECGLHLHFDASDLKPRHISNLFIILHMAEPIIFAMYPARDFSYCAPIDINMKMASRFRDWLDVRDTWYRPSNNVKDKSVFYSDNFINSTQAGDHYDGTRYHGFNIHCYWTLGTVEFRYGTGTFDLGHIKAYYEMCLSMVNTAAQNKRLKLFDNLSGKKYSELVKYYGQGYRGRKYIREMSKLCGFSRSTIKLIVDAVRENNPSLLNKDPRSIPLTIDDSNKDNFLYLSVEDGHYYTGDGKRSDGRERYGGRPKKKRSLEKALTDSLGRLSPPRPPKSRRVISIDINGKGEFSSLEKNVKFAIKIIRKVSKKQTTGNMDAKAYTDGSYFQPADPYPDDNEQIEF